MEIIDYTSEVGYTMPETSCAKYEGTAFNAAKLAEETGEVCQAIVKRKNPEEIASECMDVIQCAENMLRRLDFTDNMVRAMRANHIASCFERGYYINEGEMF